MAKVFSKDFNQSFGEAFLSTLEMERKLKEQRQQFDQQLGYQYRQLDLLNKQKDEYNQYLKSNNQRQAGEYFYNNFAPPGVLGTGRENPRKGTYDYNDGKSSTPLFPDINIEKTLGGNVDIPSGNYINKNLVPQGNTDKPNWELATKKVNGKDTRYWVNKNDPTGDAIPFGEVWHAPKGSGSPKENKLPTLGDKYQTDAFGRLMNPQDAQKPPEGVDPVMWALTGGGKQYSPENDFTTVATGLIKSSKLLKVVNNAVQFMGGYPTGEQLTNAVLEKKDLTDKELEQFQNFLEYYDQFQHNLKQPPKLEMARP